MIDRVEPDVLDNNSSPPEISGIDGGALKSVPWLHIALLLIVVAAGFFLRLYHVNWDGNQHAHPDERWIAMVASDLEWPTSLAQGLDPRTSPLNPLWSFRDNAPRSFAYGHLPLYLTAGTAAVLEKVAALWPEGGSPQVFGFDLRRAASYDHINLLGRALSALADVGVILLIYAIGKRLSGRWVGLLAAALVAFTVSHIQLAHYGAFDTFATFFIVLTLYGAVRVWQRGTYWDVALTGLAAGLALSSKFSAAPIFLPVVLSCAFNLIRQGTSWKALLLERTLWHRWILCLGVAALAFAFTSPYAILDVERFILQIGEQGAMVRGIADLPYTRQYRPTTPYLYQIEQQLRWGMGWPLGIAAFVGLLFVTARNVRRPRWGEVIVLAWAVPYFLINGSFMVKFMRYMLPLLPFLSWMAALGLSELLDWLRGRFGTLALGSIRLRPAVAGWLLIAVVVGASLFYALAFVRIYAQEHTWITASRWIYENVPDGSVLAVEHWDDNLPKSLNEPGMNVGARGYRHVELPLYEPDTAGKWMNVRAVLQQADYIVISTNRLYRTIPGLPARYPVATRYYELLFAEELGYKRVATFSSYPSLWGWEIVDDAADESFTVYDHPKPMIFAKERNLTDVEWQALFADAFAIQPRWEYDAPAPATLAEQPTKSLMLDEPVGELPVVPGIGWNRWASERAPVAAVTWWLVLQALGLLAWPLVYAMFHRLRDRGWAFAKAVGLLLVALGNWTTASLRWLPNAWYALALWALVLAGVSFIFWRRNRKEMIAWMRMQRRTWLGIEAAFTVAFCLFTLIRVLNPDLWQPWFGGEKFMEMAFLNATLRTPFFPPYDPYFAGGYLNYYYFGQYLISVLIKLTGISATVGFNLAIPTLFAMTVGHSLSIGLSLRPGRKGWVSGAVAAFSVAIMGNLTAMTQVVDGALRVGAAEVGPSTVPALTALKRLGAGAWALIRGQQTMPAFDYWHKSTRVIPNTINEFPFFSFLFADLHPHMIAIPFTLLVLGLLLNLVRNIDDTWREWGAKVARFGVLAAALGALGAINTWDLPAYLGLTALALAFQSYRRDRWWWLGKAALRFALLAGLSLFLYWPFYRHYQAISVGIGWVEQRSPIASFLAIWGLFLAVLALWIATVWRHHQARGGVLRYVRILSSNLRFLPHVLDLHAALVGRGTFGYNLAKAALWLALPAAIGLAAFGQWTLALLVPLVVWSAVLLLRDDATPAQFFVHLLTFTGLLVLLGVEILYMKDFLGGGEWRRMNTLFKFYIQVWVLFGVAMGYALPDVWQRVRRWPSRGWRWAWQAVATFLLLSSLLYPILAVPARVAQRFPTATPPIGTLDGMAYMTVGVYTWPDENHPIALRYDYEAIRWLQENVQGTPVIAEGRIDYYREGGMRVSSMTGLPTLLGAHQGEQRYDWQVGPRDGLAREFFTSASLERRISIARQLDIRYVYVGQLEREVYGDGAAALFDQWVAQGLAQIAFENDEVTIYRLELDEA